MEEKFIAHIGTDESGKGDFFGPLVIAGVLVDENSAKMFKELGIKDSKTLSDKRMLEMMTQIQKYSKFSVIAIGNAKYNELYKNSKTGSLDKEFFYNAGTCSGDYFDWEA